MVSPPPVVRDLAAHFEILAYAWFGLAAALLAALAGRPWLGLIGVVTVLPFVVAYLVVAARSVVRGRPP